MSVRRIAHVICGGCGAGCWELNTGVLSEHRTGMYTESGARERCIYSGGTWADARTKITPRQRVRLDHSHKNEPGPERDRAHR